MSIPTSFKKLWQRHGVLNGWCCQGLKTTLEHAGLAVAPPGFTPDEPGLETTAETNSVLHPRPASRRGDEGLETTAETDSVLRPHSASRRGDEGLKSLAAKLSNQGSTGVKPTEAELHIGACGSCQTGALPAQGRQGPSYASRRVVVVKPGLYRHRAGRGRVTHRDVC